jgi:ribosomal subunit interface protein
MQCGDGGGCAILPHMKLIVQGKQMRATAALRQYTEEHVVQRLQRFYDSEAAELRVELGRENRNRGESRECHMTFRMPGAQAIEIEETLPDLYGAIDVAADRLVRATKKQLERMRQPKGHHKYRPLGTVAAEGGVRRGLAEQLPSARAFRTVERQLAKGKK